MRFVALALGVGQLGQRRPAFVEERLVELERKQIGVGEIAVIVRVFLRPSEGDRVTPLSGSYSRVSCAIAPPPSITSTWRFASCSTTAITKRTLN